MFRKRLGKRCCDLPDRLYPCTMTSASDWVRGGFGACFMADQNDTAADSTDCGYEASDAEACGERDIREIRDPGLGFFLLM